MHIRFSAFAAFAALLSAPAAAATTYCCADENGHQVCSDILPQQCYGRAYREINDRGLTVKRVEAPLTPEQRAQREAEARRRKEEERVAQVQRRKDQALLDTYSSVQDIDVFRDRAIKDLEKSISDTREWQAELLKKKQALADEAEFYKKKPMPFELRNTLKDNEAELQALQSVIDSKTHDIETVKTRFDEDKRRYLEITRGQKRNVGGGSASAVPPDDEKVR